MGELYGNLNININRNWKLKKTGNSIYEMLAGKVSDAIMDQPATKKMINQKTTRSFLSKSAACEDYYASDQDCTGGESIWLGSSGLGASTTVPLRLLLTKGIEFKGSMLRKRSVQEKGEILSSLVARLVQDRDG